MKKATIKLNRSRQQADFYNPPINGAVRKQMNRQFAANVQWMQHLVSGINIADFLSGKINLSHSAL